MIPKHIEHLKFLKIDGHRKDVHTKSWPTKSEHHLLANEMTKWIDAGNNYGVICGPITGIGVIDCDHIEYVLAVENLLPQTFSVRSSSEKKRHFYFKFKNFPTSRNKISLKDPDCPDDTKRQGGDIRNGNFYVVGPGSTHPETKAIYTVIDDVPIAEVDYNHIFDVLGPYYKTHDEIVPQGLTRRNYPLPISDVIKYYKINMKKGSGTEFFCSHPLHGSDGGTNFGVNTDKNVWCCRRCGSGGHSLHLVAMMEKLIDCASIRKGSITDDVLDQALDIVYEKFGVDLYYDRRLPMNDTYNARLFSKSYLKDLRFVDSLGGWFFYNGEVWERDLVNRIKTFADRTYNKMIQETPSWVPTIYEDDDPDTQDIKQKIINSWKSHVRSSGESSRLDNMVSVSKKDLSIKSDFFDSDNYMICIKNGVFDLKNFKLLPFAYDQFITRQAEFVFDQNAKCPNWERLLKIVFLNDEKVIRYVQKILGYCLTGDISRQMFFICHGGGANGKSTIFDTVKKGLGTYATSIRSQSLIAKKDDAIPNDWAAMNKMRMVCASELETNKELDTGIVKQFTSKKPMSVRFLNKEFFEMVSTFKVFLETNPLPSVKGDDDGTWRRIKKIPFNHKFSDQDKVIDYDVKFLYPEMSGIFNWLLDGLKLLELEGENEPDCVKMSTKEYRENENSLNEFIERFCYPLDETKEKYTLASEFWSFYKNTMIEEKEHYYGKKNFPVLLAACGINKIRITTDCENKGKYAFFGVACKPKMEGIKAPQSFFSDITWTE